ncbi:hypothetical protein ALP58_102718 [Pseudomonas savastanoi]|uniref:Uncharacterized protein n=5 Tax=Pseudomonas syringae group TaxID=136849 RepID=A0A2K4WV25_PSESX|nr:hypothetical protein ALO82_102738 [Pseudomonas syringae pv. broussonetiae]KPW89328.1 hypothetical protein ALO79_100813 [Pseudomonas syringae pv. castaneae]KPX00750.1 hypothetical protein ALO50_103228 [Pseudomonas syringae pv. cerasicola]KPX54732.1 hypothetical protein ALO67_102150 [Pseudomonas amygdali pv. hibisci]RMO20387.1 hypothetical protein ALQ45_102501 [Pseudomonas amygdali pv. morsprunorum]RMR89306.1 hypothetical protein ALP77_102140 [Pseudomonas amygdali pv. tabaci]RMS68801.1 hypot
MLVVTLIVKFDFLMECRHIGSSCFVFLFFFRYLLPDPHFFWGGLLKEFH